MFLKKVVFGFGALAERELVAKASAMRHAGWRRSWMAPFVNQ